MPARICPTTAPWPSRPVRYEKSARRFWTPSQRLSLSARIAWCRSWCRFWPRASHSRGSPEMTQINVNGKHYSVDLPADTPLLWVLRDHIGLTGTKFGCGMALCGACTVHIDGKAARSCTTPLSVLGGKKVTTIEA